MDKLIYADVYIALLLLRSLIIYSDPIEVF